MCSKASSLWLCAGTYREAKTLVLTKHLMYTYISDALTTISAICLCPSRCTCEMCVIICISVIPQSKKDWKKLIYVLIVLLEYCATGIEILYSAMCWPIIRSETWMKNMPITLITNSKAGYVNYLRTWITLQVESELFKFSFWCEVVWYIQLYFF